MASGGVHDGADLRHVEILELSADRVHHELVRERLNELIVARQQCRRERDGAVDRRAAGQLGRGVDRLVGGLVVIAPAAGRAEVLERQAIRVDDAVAGVASLIRAVLLEARA